MTRKKIALIIFALIIGMQFFQTDKSSPSINPKDTFEAVADPPADLLAQFKHSCYNCHSYETKYPWYTYIAPVSFWIRGHIRGARGVLNFSTWGEMPLDVQEGIFLRSAEVLESGKMPPKGYLRMHPEANFDDATKAKLISWLEGKANNK